MSNSRNKKHVSSDEEEEDESDFVEDAPEDEDDDDDNDEDDDDDDDEAEEEESEVDVKDEEEDDGDEDDANKIKEEDQDNDDEVQFGGVKSSSNNATVIKVEDEGNTINGKRKASDQLASTAPQKLIKASNGGSVLPAAAMNVHLMDQQNNDDEEEDSEIKWRYLEHHGVLFPDYWNKHNVKVKYDGKPIELNLLQEEMATYWAQTLGSDWETKKTYKDNFSRQFLSTFAAESKQKLNFDLFDFNAIKLHLDAQRELKKGRSKEEKNAEKAKKEELSLFYAGAILDGFREKVGQFIIEPPTLFKGRGEHPKMGMMKGRIQPEAVVINIAKDAPVPKCSVPGHAWSEIVHKQGATWLASYKDDSVKVQHKYIFLAAESRLKAENDKKKYEKARRLKNLIDNIRQNYERKLMSSSEVDRQLGTATYLIDKLALRVGNEKSEEEADTVGCCSLRVEHISILEDNQIGFDFLGKDSMRYQNTVSVSQIVWKNMEHFRKNKEPSSDLFNRIDASSLNEYLKSMMEGLTAKVFRTFNASFTLQKELDKSNAANLAKMDLKDKISFYDEANRNVAILCNHQKTVGKNFDVMVGKMETKIQVYREYETELNAHLAKCKRNGGTIDAKEKEVILEKKDDGNHKMFTKKFPGTKDKIAEALDKLKKKIDEESSKKSTKEKNKEVALGTSKTNYNDPRISVNWCKKWEVPIEKVFQKTLIAKFVWAMETDLDWSF